MGVQHTARICAHTLHGDAYTAAVYLLSADRTRQVCDRLCTCEERYLDQEYHCSAAGISEERVLPSDACICKKADVYLYKYHHMR